MGAALRHSLQAGLALGAVSLAVGLCAGIASLPAGGAAVEGCSLTAVDGGYLIKSQTKYKGDTVTAQSMGAFSGQAIHVDNANGDVVVKGDPNATSVSVSTTPFAFADNSTDGSAAIADVKTSIKVDQSQSGVITVSCSQAAQSHGSASTSTTGCDGFTVTVPAGTAQSPLTLTVHAGNGSLEATGLTVSDTSAGSFKADNGDVTVSANGSVSIDAGNGTVSATVVPNKGSTIDVSAGNGDVTLALPAGFSCDSLSLQAQGAGSTVNVGSGFTNQVTATSTSVGTKGTGAASVTVVAQFGSITLQPQ